MPRTGHGRITCAPRRAFMSARCAAHRRVDRCARDRCMALRARSSVCTCVQGICWSAARSPSCATGSGRSRSATSKPCWLRVRPAEHRCLAPQHPSASLALAAGRTLAPPADASGAIRVVGAIAIMAIVHRRRCRAAAAFALRSPPEVSDAVRQPCCRRVAEDSRGQRAVAHRPPRRLRCCDSRLCGAAQRSSRTGRSRSFSKCWSSRRRQRNPL